MSVPKLFDRGSDRRLAPRIKLLEIAYIGMGPENGGLVLDVSDGGLAFQSVAPVHPAETIRFLLSLRDDSRIEGVGKVVWTNEARTLCGLRFTSLSSDARAHLSSWTNASRIAEAAYKRPLSSSPPMAGHFRDARTSPASRANIGASTAFAIPPAGVDFSSAAANRSFLPVPFVSWIMFVVLSATFSVAAYRYGVHVGKLQAASVERPGSNPGTPEEPADGTTASAPAPPVAARKSSPPAGRESAASPASSRQENAGAIPNAATSSLAGALQNASITGAVSPSGSQHGASAAGNHGAAASDERTRTAAGQSELAAALAELNANDGRRDGATAVRHLWSAVTNGNTDAEVILSGLYISGDGAEKNCEQGRVLLMAAAKSGNTTAKAKLEELNSSGCQ